MKTILHLSILLMFLAGAAGALDFFKMYHSGEIDKIYVRDEKAMPVEQHKENSPVSSIAYSSNGPEESLNRAKQMAKKNRSKLHALLQMHSPLSIRKEVESSPISLIEAQQASSMISTLSVAANAPVRRISAEEGGIFAEFSRAPLRKMDIAEAATALTADSTAASASNGNSVP